MTTGASRSTFNMNRRAKIRTQIGCPHQRARSSRRCVSIGQSLKRWTAGGRHRHSRKRTESLPTNNAVNGGRVAAGLRREGELQLDVIPQSKERVMKTALVNQPNINRRDAMKGGVSVASLVAMGARAVVP